MLANFCWHFTLEKSPYRWIGPSGSDIGGGILFQNFENIPSKFPLNFAGGVLLKSRARLTRIASQGASPYAHTSFTPAKCLDLRPKFPLYCRCNYRGLSRGWVSY